MSKDEPPDLSEEVYHRIKTLRTIQRQIQNADKSEQLPNIKAILQAYRDEELQWNPGLITYWSRGVKLCEPRPFRWDEFEAINAAHGGHKSFWTEGVSYTTVSVNAKTMAKLFGITYGADNTV